MFHGTLSTCLHYLLTEIMSLPKSHKNSFFSRWMWACISFREYVRKVLELISHQLLLKSNIIFFVLIVRFHNTSRVCMKGFMTTFIYSLSKFESKTSRYSWKLWVFSVLINIRKNFTSIFLIYENNFNLYRWKLCFVD